VAFDGIAVLRTVLACVCGFVDPGAAQIAATGADEGADRLFDAVGRQVGAKRLKVDRRAVDALEHPFGSEARDCAILAAGSGQFGGLGGRRSLGLHHIGGGGFGGLLGLHRFVEAGSVAHGLGGGFCFPAGLLGALAGFPLFALPAFALFGFLRPQIVGQLALDLLLEIGERVADLPKHAVDDPAALKKWLLCVHPRSV
jgi:hypothetical protein